MGKWIILPIWACFVGITYFFGFFNQEPEPDDFIWFALCVFVALFGATSLYVTVWGL